MGRVAVRLTIPSVNKWHKEIPTTTLHGEVDLCVDLLVEEYGACRIWRANNRVWNHKLKKPMDIKVLMLEISVKTGDHEKVNQVARRLKNELHLQTVQIEKSNVTHSVMI